MSQSPLARSTRRSLPAFSHAPSRLSKATSSRDLLADQDDDEEEPDIREVSPSHSHSIPRSSQHLVTPSRDNLRRKSKDLSGSPFTPKITYSPYATSTPPGGLSRSSSIPFDMAASAKAARKAEEDRRSSTPMPDTAAKRKRLVRRKPLWQRITTFPQTVIDKAVFHFPTSVQDMLPDEHLAKPISIGLHAIHYLLVAPLFSPSKEDASILRSGKEQTGVSSRWERWENGGRDVGSGLIGGWTKFIFLLLFLGLAAANATYLFTRFRMYDMQLRTAQEPVHSPHVSPVPAPKRKDTEVEDVFRGPDAQTHETPGKKALRLSGQALVSVAKFGFYAILSAFGKPHRNSPDRIFNASDDKIQSLRVWDPPEFCLAFFCAFPPTAPLLNHLLTALHPIYTPLLHLSTTFLLSHLAKSYNQLVKDRMVLSAEVMREYDQRFVYKRVFANRVDRGVGTNEAEHIW